MERQEGWSFESFKHARDPRCCCQSGDENSAESKDRIIHSRSGWSHPRAQLVWKRPSSAKGLNLPPPFDKSVFINCPFDDDFAPILQAVAFAVVVLGFYPRLAPENSDSAAARLDRIIELVRGSKFGIHDLTRCRSSAPDEFARMNMPFELGLDHGCRRFGDGSLSDKRILILEKTRYDYLRSLSDISGWDIQSHGGVFERAVRHVRSWLIDQANAPKIGASLIQGKYLAFQEWYWEREIAAGSSEEDIKEYPTSELVQAMHDWMAAGQPD
jgi:hypothetical protein